LPGPQQRTGKYSMAKKKEKKEVQITREWCKGCGICVTFCPKKALALDNEGKACWVHPDKCINCGFCELRCPDVAIELVER
jgi:2-oxoglutarate ferredoxin oxidoreductase subunit delta